MNIGLPCTGIGGIFYLAYALCMLPHEILMFLRNKSTLKRWVLVFKQNVIALGIMFVTYLTGIFLTILIPVKNSLDVVIPTNASDVGYFKYTGLILVSPFITLIVLVSGSWLLGKVFELSKKANSEYTSYQQ